MIRHTVDRPRVSRRRVEALAAALVPGLLLAGCSGGGGTAARGSTPRAPVLSPPPAPVLPPPQRPVLSPPHGSTMTPPTRPLRVTAAMTRPKTRLRFGQKAIV